MPFCPTCNSDAVDWRPGKAWCYDCDWMGSPFDLREERIYTDEENEPEFMEYE